MPIEKKKFSDLPSGVRSVYQKAQDVLEKNSIDYGIELLKSIIQKEPGFDEARVKLREAERQKLESMNAISKFFAGLKLNRFILKGRSLISKKPLEAMSAAEDALALYLKSSSALNLLADAALAADGSYIAADALELLAEFEPENESNLNKLATIYENMSEGRKVLIIRQKIAGMHPGDLEAAAAVRAAAALATMEQGRWNDKDASYQDKLNENADQGDRIIRATDDVREMISKLEFAITQGGEDNNIDTHRKLAELYMRDERYEDSIREYNRIAQMVGTLDPAIDKQIERATVAIMEGQAEEKRAANASEEDINAVYQQIYDYKMERYEERVRLYPNDLQLRFDLAELYWEGDKYDNALEQFQLAQRNPQRRLQSIVYLGRCFAAKSQYDMAVEQFKKAIGEMHVMDKEKMNALYHFGVTYEEMGKNEEAMDCFKQIYAVNINFMDVAQRMNAYYAKSN